MDVREIDPLYWSDASFRKHVLAKLNDLEQQIKKIPQAVKPTGGEESLRNLAAREAQPILVPTNINCPHSHGLCNC